MCVHAHATVHMWKSEDNFQESVLFFHPVGAGDWNQGHEPCCRQALSPAEPFCWPGFSGVLKMCIGEYILQQECGVHEMEDLWSSREWQDQRRVIVKAGRNRWMQFPMARALGSKLVLVFMLEGRGLLKLALGAWLWLKIQEDIRIQLRRRLLLSTNGGSWESLSCSVQTRTFRPLGTRHYPVDAIIPSERWSLGTSWLRAAKPSQLRWCGSWCLLLMLPGFSLVGAKAAVGSTIPGLWLFNHFQHSTLL